MPSESNVSEIRETSPARRWWASAIGLVVFLVAISICAFLVVRLLHIGAVEPVQIGLQQPKPDAGIAGLALLAWAASGFVSAMLAGLVAQLIAPDTSPETFRFNLIAGLVVLVIAVWVYSFLAFGFDFTAALRAALVLAGGIFGIRKVV